MRIPTEFVHNRWVVAIGATGLLLIGMLAGAGALLYPTSHQAGIVVMMILAVSMVAMLWIGAVNGLAYLRMYSGLQIITGAD